MAVPDKSGGAHQSVCSKCERGFDSEFRYCPFCAVPLGAPQSVLNVDEWIRGRVDIQIRERMKDDRLVAAEVADKVFKNLKYSLFPLLACLALLGWFGYSNLKQGIEPLAKEARHQAEAALSLAGEARKDADAARRLADRNVTEVKAFSEGARQRIEEAKAHLDQVERTADSASTTINAKFASLATTAESFDKQLSAKADQLQSYERQVRSLDTRLAQVSVGQQFPGVGAPSVAFVNAQPIIKEEKKTAQAYVVFNYTPEAVVSEVLKPDDIAAFEAFLESKGCRVFGGVPAFGKLGGAGFVVGPFKQETWHNGAWVQYFDSSRRDLAQQVFTQLSKYVRASSPGPQLVSEKDYALNASASRFVRLSGIDIYVEVAPAR